MSIKILPVIILLLIGNCYAQENLNKQVKVIKPYKPSISDAFKINYLPKIVDTVVVLPKFDYSIINAKQIPTNFEVKPIKSAKMVGEPLTKLYHSQIKLGYGSYLTPLVELDFNTLRSKKYSIGANIKHFSSNGKIKMADDRKVYAGFSENSLSVFGRKLFDEKIVTGNIKYDNQNNYYYGYNVSKVNLLDTIVPEKKDDIEKQKFNTLSINTKLKTNYTDSLNLNYDIAIDYSYIEDINKISGNNFAISCNADYFFEKEFVGFESELSYYKTDGTIDAVNYSILKFNPWIGAFSKKWQIVGGVNTYFEQDEAIYHLYPKVSLHYNIIEYFLIPYIEFTGYFENNSYKNIAFENPYINPIINVKPTNFKKIINGGLKGNFSSKIAFNFNAGFSEIDNMYFYVNDTTNYLENKFTVVYDDVTLLKLLGEISVKNSEKLNFLIKANYYKYTMNNELRPWHKPQYNITVSAQYFLRNKIIVSGDVFAISSQYVKLFDNNKNENKLEGILDMNLGIEYKYTKVLSAFIQLNNIGATKYYKWNNYPLHRFNLMFGFVYSL